MQRASYILGAAVILAATACHLDTWAANNFYVVLISSAIFFFPLLFLIWILGQSSLPRIGSPGGDFLITWLACTLLLQVTSLNHWAFSIVSMYSMSASLRVAATVAAANGALILVLRLMSAPLNVLTVSLPAFALTAAGLLFVPYTVSETYLHSHIAENLWPAAFGGLLIAYVLTVQVAAYAREKRHRPNIKLPG
ncbi:MAG: hypothetical protein KME03_01085 [Aphanocapsa lilacina HA4352-LM1]|jgi:uncharacterized membrane protein YvlD (DUF360 family)|nr:hypothetical protein [Aphanocapsa lilacina HA4352-LM1]